MPDWGALRHTLVAFGLALFVAAFGAREASAEITFPSQIPKTSDALAAIIKAVPGLDAGGIKNFKASGNSASAEFSIKGEAVTLVVFKRSGISKVLLAIVPKDFKLSTFLPIPSGTPLDGVKFKDMALVIVPKGAAKKGVSTSGLPTALSGPLGHVGQHVDFKEGLNLFGHADFTSSGAIKKVLSAVGSTQFRLPLSGAFSADVFKHDLKTASRKLKEELLVGLNLKLALPRLRIPGMPNIVLVKNAHLAIVGREVKGKRKIFAGVTGSLNVRMGNKDNSFNFGILAGEPGKQWQAKITAESKGKLTLPFIHPFELTNMQLVATKKGGKWAVKVDAKSKFRSKTVDVSYVHDPSGSNYLDVKAKITLADIIGEPSLAGLDDIQASWLQVYDKYWRMWLEFKGTAGEVSVFKPEGASKHLIAVTINANSVSPDIFIPGIANSPLKDVTFEGMSFVLAPKGSAGRLYRHQMPRDLAWRLRPAWIPGNIILKPGLNVFGKVKIHPTGEVATLLKKVGIHDLSLPLNGAISPKAFSKNVSGTAIKNEILDNLDIKVKLPTPRIPGISNNITIRNAHLAIKGKHTGGTREIDVGVSGDLRARMGSREIDFDFDIEAAKAAGAQADITITADSTSTASVSFFHPLELTSMNLTATRKAGKWNTEIDAKATLNNKPIDVTYIHDADNQIYIDIKTKLTLAELSPVNLPGLSDIELDEIKISKEITTAKIKIKGISSQLSVFKQPGTSAHFISLVLQPEGGKPASFSPSDFVPGAENSPLKNVTFHNMAFVYNPFSNYFQLHSTLPPGITKPIKLAKVNMSVAPGFNVFGHMKVHPTGEMAALLKKVGVSDLNIPLNGSFNPKALSKNISGTAIKNEILDNLALQIKLPPLAIPGISKFLNITYATLVVRGKTPSGARGIDVVFSGYANLHMKGEKLAFKIEGEFDKAGGSSEISFSGRALKPWNHPLGINFLDLEELSVDIKKKKKASGASSFDIKMAAKTKIGNHTNLDIKIDVHEKNGTVTDAFFELDGPIKLSEIPGVKDIPNANHFTINTLKISEHGIEAKTSFGGKSDLDIFLFTGSGWNLIVRQDNLALSEFVPPLKNTPLKNVILSEAAIVLSKDGLSGPLSSFSVIAQDALKDIYGKNAANIDVGSGLSLIAAFEPSKSKGGMADAFSRLGLSEERLILTGDIGGLFGGPTALNIDVNLSAHTGAKHQPKWMKSKPGVEAVFSMIATESDGQFDIEFGIGVDIIATVHGTELVFGAKTALEFEDEKIDVKIVADLKDKEGWHKPFGIPGFTLYEVAMDLGIDEDGALHLGFDGNIKVSGDTYKIAADADIEGVVPTDIAFIGSADKVDMFFMEAIAIAMIGGDFKLDIPSGILPTFTNVKFAFVTPGAADPDLHITGEGFALAGAMNWLGHELGKMNVSVSPTSGITAAGRIDNMSPGPLQLKNNLFSLNAAPTGVPDLTIDSDIKLLGALSERFHVKFSKKGVDMSAHIGAGTAADITAQLKLSGIDLSVEKPDFEKADFAISGDIKLDVKKFISGPAQAALSDIFNGLNAAFADGKKAVKTAEGNLNWVINKLNKARAKVRREKAAVEGRVRGAENRVNGLRGRLSSQWRSYHHCHGWHKWPCRVREGFRIGWTNGEIRVADAALNFVRSLISHFPIDFDPTVAALILSRDGAKETLYLAEKAIEGLDSLGNFMNKATAKLTEALSNVADINIKKASFKGDVQGIIKNDEPVDLAIDIVLFGAEIKDQFAFKIKSIGQDLAGDVEQLALLGLYALDHLIEHGVGSIPGPLKNKLKGAVATKMDAKGAAHKRELARYAKEFKNYNKTATAIQARNAAYNTAYLKAELANSSSSLDSETSETFANELIEVGHTGLCLSIAGGRVKQDRCVDGAGERWTTHPASGAQGVKAGSGYVNITAATGGDCIAPEGRWVSVEKKFSDPKLPNEGSFTFEETVFQGDGTITVNKCVNSKEYYWKVLKHGDGWMQMANLATNRCLHFSNSSAVPGHAEAEWKPCVGSANQVFRIADNITPKYHADNITIKSDFFAGCPGKPGSDNLLKLGTCDNAERFNYSVDIRGNIKFISRTSGKCLQPQGYGDRVEIVERACTQLDYQWWTMVQRPGGWMLRNAQTKDCMSIDPHGIGHPLRMDDCNEYVTTLITPVQDVTSGVKVERGTSAKLKIAPNQALSPHRPYSICTMGDMRGYKYTVLPGYAIDGRCWVNIQGRTFAGHNYRLLTSYNKTTWIQARGTIPETAIGLGARIGPQWGGRSGGKTAYSCRSHNGAHAGWTVDGRTCFHQGGGGVSTDFTVLSRIPQQAYELNLSGRR